MGLLSKGTPLSWEQSKVYHDYVKKHGILQFLNIYRLMSSRENDIFLWFLLLSHSLHRPARTPSTASDSPPSPSHGCALCAGVTRWSTCW